MTREQYIERLIAIYKLRYKPSQEEIEEFKLLLEMMPDTPRLNFAIVMKSKSKGKNAEGGRRTAGLAWQDIERVVTAENDVIEKYDRAKIDRMSEKEYYTKILERYNELKHGQG